MPRAAAPKGRTAEFARARSKHLQVAPAGKVGIIVGGRIKYIDRPGVAVGAGGAGAGPEKPQAQPARPKPQKPPKPKYDPRYLAAARELRDRYLERVNDRLMLPAFAGKYDVSSTLRLRPEGSRALVGDAAEPKPMPLLAAG